MSKQAARKALVIMALLLLGVFSLAISGYDASQINHAEAALTQSPRLEIEEQPDTPLLISFVKNNASTAYTPEIQLAILNTSDKPITAYAIRYDVMRKHWERGGLSFANSVLPNSVLRPGESRLQEVGGGEKYSDAVSAIRVSVDFVEFLDGKRWGADSYESGECLDGMRAGGRTASRYLKRILDTEGAAAVVNAVETEIQDIPSPSDRSAKWLQGFRTGIASIRGRIKQAYDNAGLTGVEIALGQPFDALEELKERKGGKGNAPLQ